MGLVRAMSLRKFSSLVPDAMAEITRLLDKERERAQERVEGDQVIEDRSVDPRKHVGRAREGIQLELQLQQTIRRN